METLITNDEQGSSLVSARELHGFLEVKSKFADWIKNRIIKYGFLENEDYTTVSKNLENGGREMDYAITLDMAKQLSMVENNEKGRQARSYFIKAEKQLRAVIATPAPLTTEQILLQQAYKLVEQSNRLDEQNAIVAGLRADVDRLMNNIRPVTAPSLAPATPPLLTTQRQAITRRVTEYCGFHGVSQSETYSYLYRRMNEVYRINVYRLSRANGASILDTIERYGHLDKVYGLIMAELTYVEE